MIEYVLDITMIIFGKLKVRIHQRLDIYIYICFREIHLCVIQQIKVDKYDDVNSQTRILLPTTHN